MPGETPEAVVNAAKNREQVESKSTVGCRLMFLMRTAQPALMRTGRGAHRHSRGLFVAVISIRMAKARRLTRTLRGKLPVCAGLKENHLFGITRFRKIFHVPSGSSRHTVKY
jgi:hypothetical protein